MSQVPAVPDGTVKQQAGRLQYFTPILTFIGRKDGTLQLEQHDLAVVWPATRRLYIEIFKVVVWINKLILNT